MKKVIYLGYYETRNNPRNCSPAAVTMMDYISSVIRKNGYNLEIISPAQTEEELPEIVETVENSKIIFLPSHGRKKTTLQRGYNKIRKEKELFFILDKHIENNDVVIAYHSLVYISILKKLRKRKNFKLILQVNEVYADVTGNDFARKKEIGWINGADAYLFSTEKLTDVIDCSKKKYVVCPGTFLVEPIRNISKEEQEKRDRIDVIYAGTFDFRKGGGELAVNTAKYLTSNYHIHICGFGNDEQISLIVKKIEDTAKSCACEISFEGCLHGEDYIQLLQKCDIGLSTQNPESAFNASSFPSKILSYMSNGLQVVSIRIPVIEDSSVGDYMYYYDTSSPEAVAKAIMKVDLDNCRDPRSIIENLNADFCENIRTILEE